MKRLLNDEDSMGMEQDCNDRVNGLALRIADLEGASPSTLAARITATETGIGNLSQRCGTIESAVTSLDGRVTAVESIAGAFDAWKGAKPAALSKLNFTVSGIGLTVLGLTVAGADKVKPLADKVDAPIDLQTARSVTA